MRHTGASDSDSVGAIQGHRRGLWALDSIAGLACTDSQIHTSVSTISIGATSKIAVVVISGGLKRIDRPMLTNTSKANSISTIEVSGRNLGALGGVASSTRTFSQIHSSVSTVGISTTAQIAIVSIYWLRRKKICRWLTNTAESSSVAAIQSHRRRLWAECGVSGLTSTDSQVITAVGTVSVKTASQIAIIVV